MQAADTDNGVTFRCEPCGAAINIVRPRKRTNLDENR